MSINLKEFVGTPLLVNRALEAIVLLAERPIAATAALIPNQARARGRGRRAPGRRRARLAVGAAAPGRSASGDVSPAERGPTRASIVSRRVIGLGSASLIALAGLLLLLEVGGGLYWWPAVIVTAYVGASVNAWVLLVEILR